MTWHDGKPFTSADVKFSLEEIWKKLHPRGRVTFGKVTAVDTPDANTVVMRLSEPTPMMLAALSSYESQVLPKHVYEGKDFTTHPALNAPIGTGPFVFKEWKKGDFIRLEKNPNYWDKGKPYLDAIVVRVDPGRGRARRRHREGRGAARRLQPGAALRRQAPDRPADREGGDARLRVLRAHVHDGGQPPPRAPQGQAGPPGDAARARPQVHRGQHLVRLRQAGHRPIASSSPFYTTQGVPQYPYDVARANAILDEAGYKRGAGNMRFKIALTFPPVQPEIPRTAEYIKQALARVGIDVELRNIDLATFIRQVYNWEFELTQNYLYLLPDPTLGVQRLYISGNIKKGTPFANAAGYENKDVDAAFAAAQTENDLAKRKELFARAQRLIQEDLPAFNLFELSFVTLYNSKLVNHTMGADGPYGSFRDTYLQP